MAKVNLAKTIRTRYAPSPTGFFHIGGAWMALQNYVYAKHFKGKFIVRMEDTDENRNVEGGIDSQLDGMKWMGIVPDESPNKPGKYGPYIQSKKFKDFAKRAYDLVKQKKAYFCFCTQEELKKARDEAMANSQTPKYNRHCLSLTEKEIKDKLAKKVPYVIRLKMPDEGEISWQDLIRGKISVPVSALTDPVILKSNQVPMYNFAVVCDDHDMKITHIIRGEEHISNTPYQIAIKEALGYNDDVQYGHLPIIVDATGKKLSKRDPSLKAFIDIYQKEGFIPQALVNFLALLGWTPNDNQEIFDLSSMIKKYDGTRISTAPAFFDVKKLEWVSKSYFKTMKDSDYLKFVKPFVTVNLKAFGTRANALLLLFKTYISYAKQLNEQITPFLTYEPSKFEPIIKETMKQEYFKTNLKCLENILNKMKEITLENAKSIISQVQEQTKLNGKELYWPLRIACIGTEHGPEMDKTLYIVGKKQILANIKKII